MKTYEDLAVIAGKPSEVMQFVFDAITDHKASKLYDEAKVAYEYFKKRNVTIIQYQKLLYTLSGEAVPDNYSANYKFCNAFFPIFIRQENSFLLGNGVTFEQEQTKEKLGGSAFDSQLIKAGEAALWGGVSFGFMNNDHIDVFKVTEFVPLFSEEDGSLRAGIRFWQVDSDKPLRATLYEVDGYTDYIWRKGSGEVLSEKKAYKYKAQQSAADGLEILEGQNYPNFPIVPLWANEEHQSEFTGLREKIDGYDLIQSGFANDLDDMSQIYWVIKNAGGMDDVDLRKFIERMKVVKAAVVDEDGSTAEAHTVDIPYNARQVALGVLRDSLYRDAMALDTDKISAGSVTATAIEAAYENLGLKCDAYEMCVTDFIHSLLDLLGVEDNPTYKRSKIINMSEDTQMVLSAAQYLDDETILKHLPFLNPDEISDIMDRKTQEEAARYEQEMGALQQKAQIDIQQKQAEAQIDAQVQAQAAVSEVTEE